MLRSAAENWARRHLAWQGEPMWTLMGRSAANTCWTRARRQRSNAARRAALGWHVAQRWCAMMGWGFAVACSGQPETSTESPSEVATAADATPAADPFAVYPVPEEDGPKLAPLALEVPVYSRPSSSSERVGYLRIGARPARSVDVVSTEDCPEGWYALRPLGFVCAGDRATTDLEQPLARAIHANPDRSKPLPYRYAFVRAIAPNYLRVPSKSEQFERELRLERHLRNWKKLTSEWDKLDLGANEVILDNRGMGTSRFIPGAEPLDMSRRFGGDGSDEVPWWLESGKRLIPNISSFKAPHRAVMAGRIKRHAGVALIDSFVSGEWAQQRRFAVSVDGRLIPTDKLKAGAGSGFHGTEIREHGLPVAFVHKAGASWWSYAKGDLKRGERLRWRQTVPLTGKVKYIRGVKMVQARSGDWLRSSDLKTAKKPRELPWFASKQRRWIQVSLTSQTMVLWEGSRPVYATLVSTGRDGMGDPKTTMSTPQGTFRVYQKHVTATMDSDVAENEFELRDVPWVMYFKGGYALHGAYWHDDFGRPRSHGCINLSPIDARYTFQWSAPDVPDQWHGSWSGETFGKGTIIHVVP